MGSIDTILKKQNADTAITLINRDDTANLIGNDATINIITPSEQKGILVPISALVDTNASKGVYVIEQDKNAFGVKNKAKFLNVDIISQNAYSVLIDGYGIMPSSEIVIASDKPLYDGVIVKR